ncbi:LysR family transcriptional regulator [Ovoidimarina sediminis]|uniref:LysR family transcriptional regulator n=1 Tax=Ovoidimarina sediminis TaxID=3079856 RepID=UPI00290D4530|nr:LysR family transcriptional regulator [Rhodophyticola sp. MJ-SS7]MDU8941862.1 LysR family transcriptional regulator [Rhodophyticola sp. MJ-SS7]
MAEGTGRVTLWGIEVFAAAAEERSISAAARRLGASPSAVSQQLSNLEAALGVTLIDRSARPLRMTPAGDLFRSRAQTILNAASQARAELQSRDLSRLSSLNLGVIEDFDADVTPALLSAMADRLSGARFLLETGASHRLYDLLEAQVLDVIIAAGPAAPADWMEVHPLLEEQVVAVVPKGLTQGGDVREVLSRTPMIRYTTRHVLGRQISDHLERERLVAPSRFEIDNYHAILAMVAEGKGWSALTPLGIMRAGRFVDAVDVVPLPVQPMGRRISLVTRAETFWDMPGEIAGRMRPLLERLVVAPGRARMPWLGDGLRLL